MLEFIQVLKTHLNPAFPTHIVYWSWSLNGCRSKGHRSSVSVSPVPGLAVAAVGFRYHVALARLALAVPFGLLLVQLRHPDSPEMLALRLQQDRPAQR